MVTVCFLQSCLVALLLLAWALVVTKSIVVSRDTSRTAGTGKITKEIQESDPVMDTEVDSITTGPARFRALIRWLMRAVMGIMATIKNGGNKNGN